MCSLYGFLSNLAGPVDNVYYTSAVSVSAHLRTSYQRLLGSVHKESNLHNIGLTISTIFPTTKENDLLFVFITALELSIQY